MVTRRGHSLAELLVAMLVLLVGMGGVVATTSLGLRQTGRAIRMQEAAAVAQSLLDSLASTPDPASGAAAGGRLRAEWRVAAPAGGWYEIEVTVTSAAADDTLFQGATASAVARAVPW